MAPRFFDLTKPENRPKRKPVNGNRAPEDVARQVLAEAPHVEQAIARAEQARMFGIPKADIHGPEHPKRELTAKQRHWIKLLLDPRWQPRGR